MQPPQRDTLSWKTDTYDFQVEADTPARIRVKPCLVTKRESLAYEMSHMSKTKVRIVGDVYVRSTAPICPLRPRMGTHEDCIGSQAWTSTYGFPCNSRGVWVPNS